jgi:hypothetical protein
MNSAQTMTGTVPIGNQSPTSNLTMAANFTSTTGLGQRKLTVHMKRSETRPSGKTVAAQHETKLQSSPGKEGHSKQKETMTAIKMPVSDFRSAGSARVRIALGNAANKDAMEGLLHQ